MARFTRSRKIDIAEDSTTLAAIQTPLPDTPKQLPLSDISSDIGVNNMPTEGTSVPSQLKQLKAAYRNAIGTGKKTKKGKNKKKDQLEVEHQDDIGDGHALVNDENARQNPELGPNNQLETVAHDDLATTPVATSSLVPEEMQQPVLQPRPVRMTRHQLAVQQAGQYISSDLTTLDQYFVDYQSQEDTSFVDDVLSAFPADAFRVSKLYFPGPADSFNHSMTNYPLSLAQEELARSTSEAASFNSINQVQEESIADEQDVQQTETPMEESLQPPAKSAIKTLEEVERTCEKEDIKTLVNSDNEDSFVEQIISRSPAKPVSRIEDSLEALDQLEEEMDAISQAALAEGIVSPVKAKRTPSKTRESVGPRDSLDFLRSTTREGSSMNTRHSSPPKQAPVTSKYASMRVKSTAPKPTPSLKKSSSMVFRKPADEQKKIQSLAKALGKRPMSVLEPTKSTKQPTRSTFELPGEAVARRLKEQREARIAQRESSDEPINPTRSLSGPKVIKSTKPPTKSTFELPGEAVSRRKREAQEARLKAQEEEERKRREFKARPVRKSIVPDFVPRETVASRARQSIVGLESLKGGDLSVSKRGSIIGAHRPSISQLNLANTSAPRAPGSKPQAMTRKPSTTSGPSMSGLGQRTVSDKEVQVQRQRAREIYNRDARLLEDMEKEKQEREAAAKRAREVAAERGRQASREWAEKQRARKLAEGDKGMSAGYGPGGQLGLKH